MTPIQLLRFLLHATVIPFFTVVGATVVLLLFPILGRGNFFDRIARIWVRLILLTTGVRITYEGRENLDPNELYVFVANHQSLFDIPACIFAIPYRLRMLAKKELFRIPWFGWALKGGGHIRIDRQNSEQAHKSVDDAINRLKTEDICPVVYPEGTRSPDGRIHRFKTGAFVLALRGERPVVPVTIIGSRAVMEKNSFIIKPGIIHVVIHEPVSTAGITKEKKGELAEQCRSIIEKTFIERTAEEQEKSA